MEKLINGYIKIEPVEHSSFVSSERNSYEESGIVLAKDETLDVPLGARVFFDSFMAKKYPVIGQEGKYQWFVHIGEVVKYDTE